MKAAIVILLLVVAVLARAYWVAVKKIDRRKAELILLRQACDAHEIKTRHANEQATRYRAEVARLALRNSELRDQLDVATSSAAGPTLTEQFLTWLAEEPLTYPEDPR